MLMVLMYHRIRAACFSNFQSNFRQHLLELKSKHLVVPGDELKSAQLNICLTFDDAYFDFYHDVFPLLSELKIKAVLAVPTACIADQITMAPNHRLSLSYHEMFDPKIKNNPALCSWDEIKTMVDSGWVIPASHGATHVKLTQDQIDLDEEIRGSKSVLESKTGRSITCLVYPYGRLSKPVHQIVRHHYRYPMRIGSALNKNWTNNNQLIYRIDANLFWPGQKNPTSYSSIIKHGLRYYFNQLRQK